VARRFAARETMASAEGEAYRRQIATAQVTLRRQMIDRNIPVVSSVDTVLNAVFVATTPDRVAELRSMEGVQEVVPMRMVKPLLNRATQLMNAPAAWTALGGQGSAGQGMKVAVLDFGIDQTHPAFQDSSLSVPSGFPKCTQGHPEDCAFTNNKVIVARVYTRLIAPGSSATNPAADSRPDDFSPRDHEGHGTAVASVIAANGGPGTVTVTGMAPKAWLGSYKIFGSPGVNDFTPESVIITALNDAVNDGMDVINFSGGITAVSGPLDKGAACGLAANTPCDLLADAFETAATKAVVVVAAGNSGFDGNNYPTFGSISTPASAPSVIAAGSITNSHFFSPTVTVAGGPSNLQNVAGQPGDDFLSPVGAYAYPVRDVTSLGNDGLACGSLPPGTLTGTFALIQRGTCSFANKVDNAFDAGAAGVILYMADASATVAPGFLDNNGIPVVMIPLDAGQALKAYIAANPAALVTIDPAGTEVDDTVDSNLLSFFSSQGPNTGDFAVKPDLVAVGTSMYMAAQNLDPAGGQFSTTRYAPADGTSFSSPLIAGAAALVKQKHPTWTPAQIKSALVNTAKQDVTTDDSQNLVDAQWLGAGKLDAGAAVNDTVVVSPPSLGFGVVTASPSPGKLTITNLGTSAVTLTVAAAAGAKSFTGNLSAGFNVAVDQTSLSLAAGAAGTVNLALTGSLPTPGSYTGAVTLKATGVSLTVPFTYYVGGGPTTDYNLMFVGAGGFEAIVGQQPFDPLANPQMNLQHSIAVKLTDGAGIPVSGSSVTWTVRPRNSVTFTNTSATTNALGIASTDLTVNQTGQLTVTVSTGGQTMTFNGFGWSQPTISAGGVVNDANFAAPIAPGSYVAIFGSNLSQFTDSTAFTTLPLSLDNLTVSFDVPSAKLSLPGRLVFISPGQINVQVPWELQGQTSAQVKVTIDELIFGNVVTVPVSDATASFFETSKGIAAARDNASGAVVTTTAPIKRGGIVQLYMNGLGPVTNQPNSGEPASGDPAKLATTKATPTVTIGGQAAQVFFSGLAPGFPGLYQVNITVPSGVATGSQPISLSIGGQTTTAATIPVK
jgi:minor extracellular serine protease Vpr